MQVTYEIQLCAFDGDVWEAIDADADENRNVRMWALYRRVDGGLAYFVDDYVTRELAARSQALLQQEADAILGAIGAMSS